jgi:hypothetical protein
MITIILMTMAATKMAIGTELSMIPYVNAAIVVRDAERGLRGAELVPTGHIVLTSISSLIPKVLSLEPSIHPYEACNI